MRNNQHMQGAESLMLHGRRLTWTNSCTHPLPLSNCCLREPSVHLLTQASHCMTIDNSVHIPCLISSQDGKLLPSFPSSCRMAVSSGVNSQKPVCILKGFVSMSQKTLLVIKQPLMSPAVPP